MLVGAIGIRGSSPLARGTRLVGAIQAQRYRLIPARAGNTPTITTPSSPWTAHPRSRGEHWFGGDGTTKPGGSSPLARGTRCLLLRVGKWRRLIPARAGNTNTSIHHLNLSQAHPRSRGEHIRQGSNQGGVVGSSPLARGTRTPEQEDQYAARLIPARAGNTRNRNSPSS